jgi:hypothetical protein
LDLARALGAPLAGPRSRGSWRQMCRPDRACRAGTGAVTSRLLAPEQPGTPKLRLKSGSIQLATAHCVSHRAQTPKMRPQRFLSSTRRAEPKTPLGRILRQSARIAPTHGACELRGCDYFCEPRCACKIGPHRGSRRPPEWPARSGQSSVGVPARSHPSGGGGDGQQVVSAARVAGHRSNRSDFAPKQSAAARSAPPCEGDVSYACAR